MLFLEKGPTFKASVLYISNSHILFPQGRSCFFISMNFVYNIHPHMQESEKKKKPSGSFTLRTSFGLFKLFHVITLSSRLQLVDIMVDAERKAF